MVDFYNASLVSISRGSRNWMILGSFLRISFDVRVMNGYTYQSPFFPFFRLYYYLTSSRVGRVQMFLCVCAEMFRSWIVFMSLRGKGTSSLASAECRWIMD